MKIKEFIILVFQTITALELGGLKLRRFYKMRIQELKKLSMNHSTVTYDKSHDDIDSDFVVIALSKFTKLVRVAEAAQRLVETTKHEPTGYIQVPLSNVFFILKEKLSELETL